MKKILTLCLALVASSAMFAQKTVVFCTENGEEITDGSVVTRDNAISHHGEVVIYSDLFLKNVSDEIDEYIQLDWEIKDMPNGKTQVCYPQFCRTKPADPDLATYPYSEIVEQNEVTDVTCLMPGGEPETIAAEWLPESGKYGSCQIVYTVYKKDFNPDDPNEEYPSLKVDRLSTVTVNYVYGDPSGINDVTAGNSVAESARYNVTGQLMTAPQYGLNIVRLANGKTVKTIVK